MGEQVRVGFLTRRVEQSVARRRDHHGVHDGRDFQTGDLLRDAPDDRGFREHAGLDRPNVEIREDGLTLGFDILDRERGKLLDAAGVLCRDARDGAGAEHAVCFHRLQVGLNPRAAAGVASGDGQRDGEGDRCWFSTHVP